ncbi:Pentatricopeptide repeat [Quillaja saponaria]|uniref:Pentatricopeptide repeat n=1 Tax=Quillaja saponaria TaxID=32244 RepID=A0AAD7Q019_QUISA|nr:Pentatricopeptide repeat [Quillaja saponaria]
MRRLLFGNQSPVALLESCKTIKEALQFHAQIIVSGLNADLFTSSRLIASFALSGSKLGLDHSRILFSRIVCPNIFIWNTMIRGYSRSDTPEDALMLYMSMLAGGVQSPNNFTFPFLVNSCARFSSPETGHQVHCHILKYGFESDIFIVNALTHLYCAFRDVEHACYVFDRSPVRDVVSYNTMISGCVQADKLRCSLQLFGEMKDSLIQPDEFTFVALLSACSLLGDPKIGKKIHCLVYKYLASVGSNILLNNAIVDMYAKFGCMNMAGRVFSTMKTSKSIAACSSMLSGYAMCGEIEAARQIFEQMDERDLVSWTAMISGYSHAGKYSEALELFVQLEALGIKPDVVVLVSVLSACARLGAFEFGRRVHSKYVESGFFGHNAILISAVIDMHAKCGAIDVALDIFWGTPKNVNASFLYNSMISGLAQHGLGEVALTIFKEMELARIRPDEVTFVALLCACAHSGLVEDGKQLFESMLRAYDIKPQIEHYGCMVDLLGRDGRLDEAYGLIQNIPFKANSVIWRAFLGACKIHGYVELAEIAGQKLLEMEPDHGARYVMLSNMLANTNQWEEVSRVREAMDNMGIQKPAGWSYVELNGTLHKFLASDKTHPEAIAGGVNAQQHHHTTEICWVCCWHIRNGL